MNYNNELTEALRRLWDSAVDFHTHWNTRTLDASLERQLRVLNEEYGEWLIETERLILDDVSIGSEATDYIYVALGLLFIMDQEFNPGTLTSSFATNHLSIMKHVTQFNKEYAAMLLNMAIGYLSSTYGDALISAINQVIEKNAVKRRGNAWGINGKGKIVKQEAMINTDAYKSLLHLYYMLQSCDYVETIRNTIYDLISDDDDIWDKIEARNHLYDFNSTINDIAESIDWVDIPDMLERGL